MNWQVEIIGLYANRIDTNDNESQEDSNNLILIPSTTMANYNKLTFNYLYIDYDLKQVWSEYKEGIEKEEIDFYSYPIIKLINKQAIKTFDSAILKTEFLDFNTKEILHNIELFRTRLLIDSIICVCTLIFLFIYPFTFIVQRSVKSLRGTLFVVIITLVGFS